ncbi:unnamed protein product [Owenia fusiformis]|uniref:Uncharacterized protein n=1 Tax=Owenia fusiformis TaxID=6347 RepID=A0A8J1TYY2_OWEFU|nr:unnamed protein product [Owenia fusiformis]
MGQAISSCVRFPPRTLIKEDLSEAEEQRLSHFVTEIYNEAKLKHNQADLAQHEQYIRTRVVQPIIDKFNKMHPLLTVTDTLLNGSMSNGTKIEMPCEYDYMLPIALSGNKQLKISKYDNGTLFISLSTKCNHELQQLIEEEKYEYLMVKVANKKYYFNPVALKNIVHMALNGCLLELHKEKLLIYKRMKSLKYETPISTQLDEKEVILDDRTHGPCSRLRAWGPLCVTDIDLGVCLKIPDLPQTEDSFYMALPPSRELYWKKSFYEKPHIRATRLNQSHVKIIMAIKYILSQFLFHSSVHVNGAEIDLHSHALFTIVRCHQEKCQGKLSLGQCFYDTIYDVCRFHLKSITNPTAIEVHDMNLRNLQDKDCSEIHLLEKNTTSHSFTGVYGVVLYTLMRLIKFSEKSPAEYYCRYLENLTRETELEVLQQHLLQGSRKESLTREQILAEQDINTLLYNVMSTKHGIYLNVLVDTEVILSRVKIK